MIDGQRDDNFEVNNRKGDKEAFIEYEKWTKIEMSKRIVYGKQDFDNGAVKIFIRLT